MANNKSGKKRIKINKRNRLQNRFYKSSLKTLINNFQKKLENYKISQNLNDKQEIEKIVSSLYRLLDKGTKKHVFHKNTAARKKSRLSNLLKTL